MDSVKGKRLLVLGGTYASLDVVKTAKAMGAYVIVTDEAPLSERVAKAAADAHRTVSTTDMDGLMKIVRDDRIDGVFCGPSEFNIRNMIRLCALAGLPCYATEQQWDRCSDKLSFKAACLRAGVPTARKYPRSDFENDGADSSVAYPVIVKPADGCSSKGVTVCYDRSQVLSAFAEAERCSAKNSAFAEQYLDNGGRIFGARYVLNHGQSYPYLSFDTYVVDPRDKKHLISALSVFPSSLTPVYAGKADGDMRRLLSELELSDGVAFFQTVPLDGSFYCMDMGYRLSGGMFCKITEPLLGINDMKMMIRYALGGEICTDEEKRLLCENALRSEGVQPFAQLTVPLNAGTVASVNGLEEALAHPCVTDFLQYYRVGDTVSEDVIGTLGQHFGRFTLTGESKAELLSAVNEIQSHLSIKDTLGREMFTLRFDTSRVL